MVDPRTARRWAYQSLFLGLVALILFFRLLPLSMRPVEWPTPDLLLCLTVVWVLRRPDYIPVLAVAGVFLLEDLLTMRPPGLWALIVLIGTEFLRRRENATRDLPFGWEWLMAGGVMLAMGLVYRFALALFMIPQVSFGPVLVQMLATAAIYPLLAIVLQLAFGLRRSAPGEIDAFGQRL
ncbi:MAG: rod shape-determining protein MreD [Rhodobacteraceae bacterium]|nr:rod shape-determining protein MreD [Paracoccaceae bacterium]